MTLTGSVEHKVLTLNPKDIHTDKLREKEHF